MKLTSTIFKEFLKLVYHETNFKLSKDFLKTSLKADQKRYLKTSFLKC